MRPNLRPIVRSSRLLTSSLQYHSVRVYSSHASNQQENSSSNQRQYSYLKFLALTPLAAASLQTSEHPESDKKESNKEKDSDVSISKMDIQKINYQNKIRRFSTPDKNFRLFATVKVYYEQPGGKTKGIVYMTPDDLVRSITPGSMQPTDLDLDSYSKINEKNLADFLSKNRLTPELSNLQDSNCTVADQGHSQQDDKIKLPKTHHRHTKNIFDDITKDGLLTFSDYIFLLTVISTSSRHWKILFKVFDQNGDGEVDREEFKTVMKLAQNSSSTGEKHRDTGDNKAGLNKKSAVINYFFPEEHSKLRLEEFEEFYERLRLAILRIQFDKEQPDEQDRIKLLSLCKMLLAYIERIDANSASEFNRCKKVLKELHRKPNSYSDGVTFKEVEGLFRFLSCVEDIEMALDMHTSANVELTKKEFKHVAYVVANERLDDKLVDVVYAVFDQDASGGLSHREFLKTIKSRASFGLDKPKDTGLWRFFNSFYLCGKETFKNMFKF